MSYKNLRITGIPAPLPTDYDRQVNFTDFEILNPGTPPRGADLDAEFNAVQQGLDETQDRLELIQRDDGALQNESVGLDQLKTEAKIGVNTPADWQAFTQYQVNDSVIVNDGAWYIAVTSHVSSDDFDSDLLDGRWEELIDLTPYTVEAKNWADYPVDDLVPEGNLVDEYSAYHHRVYAETAQAAAETAESGAVTARTGAETAETGANTAADAAQLAESGAVAAETGAVTAQTNAEAALADFRGRYWGAFAAEPSQDTNGDFPDPGDLYFNTVSMLVYVYTGSAWKSIPQSIASEIIFTAAGNIASTNLQDALEELDTYVDAQVATLDARITSEVATLDADKVDRTGPTGAAILPAGTTAQRPGGTDIYFRYNTELETTEVFNGTEWGGIGGATGAGGNPVFYENDQVVTGDYTIPADKNASSTGPITIQDGVTVTVSDGATWVIH